MTPAAPPSAISPSGPEPRRPARAVPEQHDLGDDALGPEDANDRIGKAELAPVEGAEAVIELMARLQRRAARDE